jgi:hypothetical protein
MWYERILFITHFEYFKIRIVKALEHCFMRLSMQRAMSLCAEELQAAEVAIEHATSSSSSSTTTTAAATTTTSGAIDAKGRLNETKRQLDSAWDRKATALKELVDLTFFVAQKCTGMFVCVYMCLTNHCCCWLMC